VHRPEPGTDVEETLAALTDLQRQGKIRAFGSSTFPAPVEVQWTAQRRGLGRFVTEQPPYSILVRGIEADLLPVAERYGLGVLPWSPLAGGWLTGRYRKGQDVPQSRRAVGRRPRRDRRDRPAGRDDRGRRRRLRAPCAVGSLPAAAAHRLSSAGQPSDRTATEAGRLSIRSSAAPAKSP
jgi:aryl-alcohol dehydrogenase-like predicted oxidoreductase